MAYSELIKSFERIRGYVREFYVCGFRTRGQYTDKSARSYDNERRRIESYLDGYIGSHRTREGKNMFVSIDSRAAGSNPLYRVLKAKSFTDGDITLHFILFDILYSPEIAFTLAEITQKTDEILAEFPAPMCFEESTVRKKLAEYARLGLVTARRQGRQTLYSRARSVCLTSWRDALEFFSEAAPCGAAGNFLLDKLGGGSEYFTFKHHYITQVLESEVLCALFAAISERRGVSFTYSGAKDAESREITCVPLRIFVSVQTGRQWLAAQGKKLALFRLDRIRGVKPQGVCPQFAALRDRLGSMQPNIWGASLGGGRLERVCFTLRIPHGGEFMLTKLEREKRCGTVEILGGTDEQTLARFTADVYDSAELIPWIRSFTGYIAQLSLSNKKVEETLLSDLEQMYALYDVE